MPLTNISFATVPSTGQLDKLQQTFTKCHYSCIHLLFYLLVYCDSDVSVCIWIFSAINVITWKNKRMNSQHFSSHQQKAIITLVIHLFLMCGVFKKHSCWLFQPFDNDVHYSWECWICCSIRIVLWRSRFTLM